jgi:tetratricopeptide (TPR) repeat protein
MTQGVIRAGVFLAGLCAAAAQACATPLDDAVALYRHKKYAEARAALEPLVAANPSNAAAAYFLAMTLQRAGGPGSLDAAKALLAKAVKLSPGDSGYLGEYAGVCLLLADRDSSLSLAMEGSSDMARAIEMNPDDLEARQGLMQFYAKAPWPLGDPAKALDMAAEIARRDPKRGLAAYLSIQEIFERHGRAEDALSARRAAQSLAPAQKG